MTRRTESEVEWLDNLRSKLKGIDDSIEKCLESRSDELPSVTGEFSFVADVVDDKESRNSKSSDASQVDNSAQKFVELLSKSAQSKGNKSAPKFRNKNSDSEEKESEEDKLDKGFSALKYYIYSFLDNCVMRSPKRQGRVVQSAIKLTQG